MNKQQINKLSNYLKIPSVANTKESGLAANWLTQWMNEFCDSVKTVGKINPLIRGYIKGSSNKTICLYGHYDVQSAIQKDGWNSDPFIPKVTEENIIARGACDNKGQNFAFLTALENLIKSGKKPNMNVLILLEGEEEIGSPHLEEYLLADKKANESDYYLLADGTSPKNTKPALYTGSLGVIFGKLEIDNGRGDLHSGIYGSEVVHSAQILVGILRELYLNSHEIIVDFKNIEQWSFSVTHLSAGSDPTKSIIPGKASAILSYRFSSGVKSTTIIDKLKVFLNKQVENLEVNLSFKGELGCEATELKNSAVLLRVCEKKLKEINSDYFIGRLQGSLPIASIIKNLYNKDPLIVSFGSKDNNTHGANEFMRIKNIESSILFFEKLLGEN
jgi:acetylornithine deacetylase/succinyl-diaminopimelate desuccinylase-like protein